MHHDAEHLPPLSEQIGEGMQAASLTKTVMASKMLLHGFIKKTQATPGSEIDLAEKRFKEWKHGEK